MAEKRDKPKDLPSPAQVEEDRRARAQQAIGFDAVLRYLALGMAPTAPRIPEQAMYHGSYFGGYPKGYTSRQGAKGSINFQTLRDIAERSALIAACLSTRQHQRVRFSRIAMRSKRGEVGFRVVHRRAQEKGFKTPEGFDLLCREAEQMLMQPWRMFWDEGAIYKEIEPNNASFASKFVEDLLVINRPAIELALDPLRIPRGFGAIDGANVIPTFQALKYVCSINKDFPKDFDTSYHAYRQTMQRVAERYKINVDERTEYLFLQSGRPVAGYRSDELILAPIFPTSDVRRAGYPKSLTEKAIFLILSEIMAMTANSRYFEFGSMAEVIVAMKGQWDDKHIKDLESIMQGNMSGVPGMFRTPLVAVPNGKDDIDVIQLKQNHRDMLFDIYIQKLTNLCCAVFRMHPSEINEAPRAGDNAGALNQASQTKQINMAQEQGLETILQHEKQSVYDPILQRIDPDLCLEWDYGQNEMEQLQVTQSYGPITTVNERRSMMGLDPLEDERGDVIDNQFVQAMLQQKQQAEQAAQQQAAAGAGSPEAGQEGNQGQEQPPSDEGDQEEEEKPESKPTPKGKAKEEGGNEPESDESRFKRIARQSR